MPEPGVYVGRLRHRRFTPRSHEFEYRIFMVLIDIDHIPEAMAVSALTSYNRPNWASFDDRDHLGPAGEPLRERVRANAAAAGHTLPDGPIMLLTHLRYAGYGFNPISLFYCFDRSARLRLVLAEVNNTYGGRQTYWLTHDPDAAGPLRARAAKSLHVSPFMDLDLAYDFVLTPPGDHLVAHMNVVRPAPDDPRPAPLFDATLRLDRRPWTSREIRRALLRFPLMTLTVIAAIHWQALRLYLKGLAVTPFPEPAARHRTKV